MTNKRTYALLLAAILAGMAVPAAAEDAVPAAAEDVEDAASSQLMQRQLTNFRII